MRDRISLRLSVAFAALIAAACAASAEQYPPRRAEIFEPPAVVALTGREKAPAAAQPVDARFASETPPSLALLDAKVRMSPAEPDSLDLAWALLGEDRRTLALALGTWAGAPEVARDAGRRRIRAEIALAYAARGFEPFWTDAGGWREAAVSAMTQLRAAGDDGLDLRAFAFPSADLAAPRPEDELALSEAVAAYALQARGARIQPERISRLIGARLSLPNAPQALSEVAAAGPRAGETLQAFNPPHYGYQQLREKLVELRARRAGAPAFDERVAAAAQGLSRTDAPPSSSRAGRRRAETMASAAAARVEAEIVANMERWRWLPRDLGDTRVEVNIPDFELAVVRGGEVTHRARIIVGKEETPTPIFSNAMQHIIVNPYWNVPQSIIQKEMLPKGGVETLAGRGFTVSYRGGKLIVRQPPGEKNALGRIKFVFPNDFAVYMHDTPSRSLFAASHRAFSHGCMRVEAPFALAEAVLGPGSGWSQERVRRLIGGSERYINLSKPVPVHIEYFTAYVDEGGRLALRPDLYGYSARVRKALGLGA